MGLYIPSPIHARILTGLVLCRSCACHCECTHSCCEITCATAPWCLAITACQHLSSISGSYNLCPIFYEDLWDLVVCVYDTVVPFGAECSTLACFLHFGIHKDEEEHFMTPENYMPFKIWCLWNKVWSEHCLLHLLVCCLWLLLNSNLNNWQILSDLYSIYYLIHYGKSQPAISWSEWKTNNPVLIVTLRELSSHCHYPFLLSSPLPLPHLSVPFFSLAVPHSPGPRRLWRQ